MKFTDPHSGESYFSKRRTRFEHEHSARALTFCCYRRYPFLSRNRTRSWFVDALQEARGKFSIDLWAWVLMPDHVHLLIWPRTKDMSVGKFQSFVKERVSRQAIRWMTENSPEWISKITVAEGQRTRRRFWQPGGGYDRNLVGTQAILMTIDYLHLNPVRRGLAEKAIDWEWSSARWYAGEQAVPLKMDRM